MMSIILVLASFVQATTSTASTTTPLRDELIAFESQIDANRRLEVKRTHRRRPAEPPDGDTANTIPALFVDTFVVRLTIDDRPEPVLLWEYERNIFNEWPSTRYQVFAATVIGGHLFVVEKMNGSTNVLMVRPRDGDYAAKLLGWKHLWSDSEVDGPAMVSAEFRIGKSLSDSWIVLNHDRKQESRREFRLIDCFPDQLEKDGKKGK